MTLFSSDRERRLWTWLLVVLIGIYSTLGLAPSISGVLRNEGLLAIFVFFSMFLLATAIVIQGLKRRPDGAEIGVWIGIAAVYILVLARLATPPEERTHLMEYTLVALLIYEALHERVKNGRRVPVPALLAIVLTTMLGILDECIQALIPNRVFDPIDILFNTLAGLMAVLACVALARVRNRRTEKQLD